MIGVYLYGIFGASAGNKSSHPKDESNSITNQRNLIMEYIKSDAVLSTYTVREYIDDGISGTRFDREAFEEMMTQVKEGNIQVIITKDYSRLGRDYLEVGRYLPSFNALPCNGNAIRFPIATFSKESCAGNILS